MEALRREEDLRAELNDLTAELDDARRDADNAAAESEAKRQRLETKLGETERALTAANERQSAQASEHSRRLERASEELAEMHRKLIQTQSEAAESAGATDAVRKRLEGQLADAAALAESRVTQLERDLELSRDETNALKTRIASLEVDESQTERNARELADAERKVANAEQRLRVANETAELASADLRARLSSAERAAASAERRADAERRARGERESELERSVATLRHELERAVKTTVSTTTVSTSGLDEGFEAARKEVESLEAENAELRRRVTETFQALQGAHTVAEQTKRAAQETVRVAKRAQAVAEADLAHVREELAAAHAANALTSHAAEAQLDMDQGRLGELNAALEAQQLALEAAQRNVARESDRADAAAAAAARRVAELNDARDEIDRLRAALEVHVGHRSGRGV